MAKAMMTITAEPQVIEMFQHRFPRKASAMINGFMRNMLDVSVDIESITTSDQTLEKLRQLEEERSKLDLNLQALKSQYAEQVREKSEKQAEHYQLSEACRTWVKDQITFAKQQRKYTDLVFEAEKHGQSVEMLLTERWNHARQS